MMSEIIACGTLSNIIIENHYYVKFTLGTVEDLLFRDFFKHISCLL
jgi:hypothetical protein